MRLVPILVVITALVAVPAASAKEVTKVTACGPERCVTSRDPAVLHGMMDGGPPAATPAAHGGGFRLSAVIEEPDGGPIGRFENWWIPGLRLLAGEDGTWIRLPAGMQRALSRATRGLAAFRAAALGVPAAADTPPLTPGPLRRGTAGGREAGGEPAWPLVAALLGGGVLAAGGLLVIRRGRAERGGAPGVAAR